MRLLIAFVVCFLALPVHACMGRILEDTLFFQPCLSRHLRPM